MTKKAKNKGKRLPAKQKAQSDLAVHEHNRKAKKERSKNLAFAKSNKKDLGIPLKDQAPKEFKNAEQQRVEEKLKRREAIKLLRDQAREKALEERRAKVIQIFQNKLKSNFYSIRTPHLLFLS